MRDRLEGAGATRRETAHLIDAAIWVQADERETERRELTREGSQPDRRRAARWGNWTAEEIPFLAGRAALTYDQSHRELPHQLRAKPNRPHRPSTYRL